MECIPFILPSGKPAALITERLKSGTVRAILCRTDESDVEALSQGPSAGGYCKRTQAIERLAAKLGHSLRDLPRDACSTPDRFAKLLATPAGWTHV